MSKNKKDYLFDSTPDPSALYGDKQVNRGYGYGNSSFKLHQSNSNKYSGGSKEQLKKNSQQEPILYTAPSQVGNKQDLSQNKNQQPVHMQESFGPPLQQQQQQQPQHHHQSMQQEPIQKVSNNSGLRESQQPNNHYPQNNKISSHPTHDLPTNNQQHRSENSSSDKSNHPMYFQDNILLKNPPQQMGNSQNHQELQQQQQFQKNYNHQNIQQHPHYNKQPQRLEPLKSPAHNPNKKDPILQQSSYQGGAKQGFQFDQQNLYNKNIYNTKKPFSSFHPEFKSPSEELSYIKQMRNPMYADFDYQKYGHKEGYQGPSLKKPRDVISPAQRSFPEIPSNQNPNSSLLRRSENFNRNGYEPEPRQNAALHQSLTFDKDIQPQTPVRNHGHNNRRESVDFNAKPQPPINQSNIPPYYQPHLIPNQGDEQVIAQADYHKALFSNDPKKSGPASDFHKKLSNSVERPNREQRLQKRRNQNVYNTIDNIDIKETNFEPQSRLLNQKGSNSSGGGVYNSVHFPPNNNHYGQPPPVQIRTPQLESSEGYPRNTSEKPDRISVSSNKQMQQRSPYAEMFSDKYQNVRKEKNFKKDWIKFYGETPPPSANAKAYRKLNFNPAYQDLHHHTDAYHHIQNTKLIYDARDDQVLNSHLSAYYGEKPREQDQYHKNKTNFWKGYTPDENSRHPKFMKYPNVMREGNKKEIKVYDPLAGQVLTRENPTFKFDKPYKINEPDAELIKKDQYKFFVDDWKQK